jgi:hypothetical protein
VESGEYSIIGYKVGNTEIGDTIFPESLEGSSVEIFRANEQTNEIRGLEYDHIRKELVISYTDADRNDQLLLLSKDGAIRGNIDGDFQYSHGTFIDDAGFYYVCDTHNERVLKITREGQIQLEIPFPEEMGQLADIAVDSEGNIYVISQPTGDWVHLIHSFDASGALRFSIGSEGTGDGEFGRADKASTNSIVVDELNDRFIVTDYENNRLQVFSLSGDFISIWKPTGLTISKPQALAMDNNGYIYVAATNLFVLSSTGEIVEWFARLDDPYGIDIDEDGFIYVASRSGHHILRVEPR